MIDFELFKQREQEVDTKVDVCGDTYLGVRLDGRSFHTLTKGCEKPFDIALLHAMVGGMECAFFALQNCIAGYTCSDEVSLVFKNPTDDPKNFAFQGRTQKIISILSSAMSVGFSKLSPFDVPALFDGRIFLLNGIEEVKDYFSWRRIDCMKNAISTAAVCAFGHNAVMNLSSDERWKMLQNTEYAHIPNHFYYGIGMIKDCFFVANRANMEYAIEGKVDKIDCRPSF